MRFITTYKYAYLPVEYFKRNCMKPFRLYILLFPFLILQSCSAQKKVTSVKQWKGDYLQFGKGGGGVTGASRIYTLLANGQMFSKTTNMNVQEKELIAVSKKQAKIFFKRAAELQLNPGKISEPGNIYNTFVYCSNGVKREVIWGTGKYTPSEKMDSLVNDLMNLAKAQTPDKKKN